MLLTCLLLLWLGGLPGCPGCKLVKLPRLSGKEPRVSARGLPLAGVHRRVKVPYTDKRNWTLGPDGHPVWRIAIRSPGAVAIRVHLTGLPGGKGVVWAYNALESDPGRRAGPYRSAEDLWTDTVFSDTVTVEYRPDRNERVAPFRIPEISHLFRE